MTTTMTMTTCTSTPLSLSDFPEELLDRILALSLTPTPPSLSPRPAWHPAPARQSTRLSPLLLSRRLYRIATPHLYRDLHLTSAPTPTRLLDTLRTNPPLAAHVHSLTLSVISSDSVEVLALCTGIKVLDVSLEGIQAEGDDKLLMNALCSLRQVAHLTLRKPGTVYLSLPRARTTITALAAAIDGWPLLESANIAFKLSDDTPTSPIAASTPSFASFIPAPHRSQTLPLGFALPTTPPQPSSSSSSSSSNTSPALPPSPTYPSPPQGPITALTTALARAPNLHTFTTHLPSVWNVAILAISANPRLERIVLVDGRRPARASMSTTMCAEPPSPTCTIASPVVSPPNAGMYGYTPFSPPQVYGPAPTLQAKQPHTRALPCRLAINTNTITSPNPNPNLNLNLKTTYTPGQCSPSSMYAPSPQIAHAREVGGIIGTGLFLMEARKHARLDELIRSGTVVVRGRAFTMGSPGK